MRIVLQWMVALLVCKATSFNEKGVLMEKGYFAAAWGDITKSPGWASILLRLGALCLVPVFGVIVLYGYLFSWARDISWNVHRPLPKRLLANEDGALYRRGFFTLVVALVFSLVLGLASSLFSACASVPFAFGMRGDYLLAATGVLLWLVVTSADIALAFLSALFIWVGSMRVALYGTLSSGFQIRKIWAMMRYDFIGLLRILGMNIVVGAIICFAALAVGAFLVLFCSGLIWLISGDSLSTMFAAILLAAIGAVFAVALLFASALQNALTVRALGYWTRQFEVSKWNGQEDPMPFERASNGGSGADEAHDPAVGSKAEAPSPNASVNEARYDRSKAQAAVSPIPNSDADFVAQVAPFKKPGQDITSPACRSAEEARSNSDHSLAVDAHDGRDITESVTNEEVRTKPFPSDSDSSNRNPFPSAEEESAGSSREEGRRII